MRAVRTRHVENAEFTMGKEKSLVVLVNSSVGIDRICIENERSGRVRVRATGHSRFTFTQGRTEPGTCDFFLGNPRWRRELVDYLDQRFFGQFTFGDLAKRHHDRAFKVALRHEIEALASEFESLAVRRLTRFDRVWQRRKNSKREIRGKRGS